MSTEPQAQGIDVSKWQQQVDWAVVRSAGISFAFAKASEVTFTDPTFTRNWQGMRDAGVLRGAYQFFRPAQDPVKQADYFARLLEADPGELPPVLDVEGNDGLGNAALIQKVFAALTRIEQNLGRKPLIYTRAGFWNPFLWDKPGHYPDWAPNYSLWVAHYTAAPQPLLPKSWTRWDFWQYTETGKVNGIKGNVDRNRFNGTEGELMDWAGLNQGMQGDVVSRYFEALNVGDVDGLVALYHPDAVLVTVQRTISGLDDLRAWYADLLQNRLPGALFRAESVFQEGMARTFTWTCASAAGNVTDGQDTLRLLNGQINYHNMVFTVTPP